MYLEFEEIVRIIVSNPFVQFLALLATLIGGIVAVAQLWKHSGNTEEENKQISQRKPKKRRQFSYRWLDLLLGLLQQFFDYFLKLLFLVFIVLGITLFLLPATHISTNYGIRAKLIT